MLYHETCKLYDKKKCTSYLPFKFTDFVHKVFCKTLALFFSKEDFFF